ncbi:MAG: MGMT family protein [Thermoguttaceae bacterium]
MPTASRPPVLADRLVVFPSNLGWMALVAVGETVRRLTFGHLSAAAAAEALGSEGPVSDKRPRGLRSVVERLQAFAAGKPDSLSDIPVETGPVGEFARRVLDQCRRIPYGRTMTYAALAAQAGFPRAARAVGNCMAANRTPLLTPCHRVVCSGGALGRFSAPGGIAMKRRLLQLEAAELG